MKKLLSLVRSGLDYRNVLLVGKTAAVMRGLQVSQNYAATFITGLDMYDHNTPVPCEFHWLPVYEGVKHMVLSIAYKTLNSQDAPVCLRDRVARRVVGRTLRASGVLQLTVPRTAVSAIAEQCFSVAAPSS